MAYDFTKDADKTFHLFEKEPGYKEEFSTIQSLEK